MQTNKQTLATFFSTLIKLVSEGTSDNYAKMVIKKFLRDVRDKYFFVDFIDSKSLSDSPAQIAIDDKINSIEAKTIGKFISEMMTSLFSDLFRHLLAKKMSPELLTKLKEMGVEL